jgi:hypothetical protein
LRKEKLFDSLLEKRLNKFKTDPSEKLNINPNNLNIPENIRSVYESAVKK